MFWKLNPQLMNCVKIIFVTHGVTEGGGLISETSLTKSLTHLWPQGCRQTLAWLSKHIVQESSLTLIRRNNSNCKCLKTFTKSIVFFPFLPTAITYYGCWLSYCDYIYIHWLSGKTKFFITLLVMFYTFDIF